ncbi:alpha/beta-hydrolase [Trametes versicolor FP-101664 SS1]|uniref:alpha/beta-hydrolase n=1 Tax=Trametes versicolor (strain FP-101664) TaxID=717944 RepID=UPI0004622AAF|nr:alpha/beta-hydrolase [Trametes versicolor FP-101664 SS1]EIW62380.1 alpha/beta-hydrolase [Trametes versicolor FP-101664 SS1]
MKLDTTEFTLKGLEADGGLALTFVRATPKQGPQSAKKKARAQPIAEPPRRLSLIFLHCVASHKETWLPTIEHLFDMDKSASSDAFTLVEAWCMDAPSHGRAAVLNEKLLETYPEGTTGVQWARGVQVLLKSGVISGNNVVGVGHSAGACIVLQSTEGYPLDRLPYSSLILIEPGLMTRAMLNTVRFDKASPLTRAAEAVRMRKDIWPSRAAAREWLTKRFPYRRWDARVLDLFVEHALRDLPTTAYTDKGEGVTLAVTQKDEIAGYSHYEDAFAALDALPGLCRAVPTHAIFGSVIDIVPPALHACTIEASEGGLRSVVRVEGAGHLVVQEDPRAVAQAIWGILHEDHVPPPPASAPTRGAKL